jgi:dTDP-4-amino-4,6-dideoxygalactose transaminase
MSDEARSNRTATEVPALAGGEKAKQTPYGSWERYGEEEIAELREAIEQQTLFYARGRKVKQLEEEIAARVGAAYAIACSSCTAAIHAAMIALGVSPGDEVIVPPITDMGTVAGILFQGAVPVFADLTPNGYTLDPDSVEACVTGKTRAVIAVHLGGAACDLPRLKAICERHGIFLVEDCAQAWDCRFQGKPVGTTGQVSCYSYNEFKHISCGDGGLVVTDDGDLARRLRLATDKGYDRGVSNAARHPLFLCNNYRMTELQGAVALAQLRKLDWIVERRRAWCETINKGLAGVEGLALPEILPDCDPSWWFYLMRVVPNALNASADRFVEVLQAEGINCGAHYIGQPVYRWPIFAEHSAFSATWHPYETRDYSEERCPVAEEILETCVLLSVNEAYTERDADEVVLGIRRAAAWLRAQPA